MFLKQHRPQALRFAVGFSIYKITLPVKFGKEWKFSVSDKEGNIFPIKIHEEKDTQHFYLNGENLGEFKIIDIV